MDIQELRATRSEFPNAHSLYEKIKSDAGFKSGIETLYFEVFKKKLTKGCSSCWFDAYIELTSKSIKRMMEQKECKYALRAGALLQDVAGDNDKMASNANLTNELAEYHLKSNPTNKRLFTKPSAEEIDTLIEEWQEQDKLAQEAKEQEELDAKLAQEAKDKEVKDLKIANAETKLKDIREAIAKTEEALKSAEESKDDKAVTKANTALTKFKVQETKAIEALEKL